MHLGISILVGTAIGIPLAVILMVIRRRCFLHNFPTEAQKQLLISEIVKMKQEGRNYADRLAYLRKQGILKDVADVLLGEAERSGR